MLVSVTWKTGCWCQMRGKLHDFECWCQIRGKLGVGVR